MASAEQRLARLEELLQQRCQLGKHHAAGSADSESKPERQASDLRPVRRQDGGFSLIEMLIVIGIIGLLIAMAVPTLTNSMSKNAVRDAASVISSASDQARQLALRSTAIGDDFAYGVQVTADDPSGDTIVRLVVYDKGTITAVTGANGQAVIETKLARSTICWLGDEDLASSSDKELLWFFGSDGQVRIHDGIAFSRYPVGVGLPQQRVDKLWGMAANTGFTPVIAPSTADNPGLSLRDTNNSFGVAVVVHPVGTSFLHSFDPRGTQDGSGTPVGLLGVVTAP